VDTTVNASAGAAINSPAAVIGTASPIPAIGLRVFNWTQIRTRGASAATVRIGAFIFGKPRNGVCVMTNSKTVMVADLVKRGGNGSVAQYYRPDDDQRWQIPAIALKLTPTVLVPCVTMEAQPKALVVPFVESWAGAAPVLELLADPTVKGVFYTYSRGISDGSIGGYVARRIPVDEEPWEAVYKSIKWPTPIEVWATIPVVSFARMMAEDHAFEVLAQEAAA